MVDLLHLQMDIFKLTKTVLIKANKYGQLQWQKYGDTLRGTYTIPGNILKLFSGNYFVWGRGFGIATTVKHFFTCYLLSPDGNIIWRKGLNLPNGYEAGISASIEATNGDIVAGGIQLAKFRQRIISPQTTISEQAVEGYFFCRFNQLTGDLKWYRNYNVDTSFAKAAGRTKEIVQIFENADRSLSFFTAFTDSTVVASPSSPVFPYTRPAVITTDSAGSVKNVIRYENGSLELFLPTVYFDSSASSQILGVQDRHNSPSVLVLDANKNIVRQNSFVNPTYQQNVSGLIKTFNGGYGLFNNLDRTQTGIRFLMTNSALGLPCEEMAATFIKDSSGNIFIEEPVQLVYAGRTASSVKDINVTVKDVALTFTKDCEQACCYDYSGINNPQKINLCAGSTHILPDGFVVKDSGTYYVKFTTAFGCDSIAYYKVQLLPLPVVNLGADTCLGSTINSLLINGPVGYSNYTWNNIPQVNPHLIVTTPGIYRLVIQNQCGQASDSIEVFEKCEFNILMPNAFTPDDNGINDFFGVPVQNKNKLVSFDIYNRWGEKIYSATQKGKGWNGNYKGVPQPSGVYVYYLVMKGIDDKKIITKKSTVMLIR
jgi:gliding motility-associated-like protein